MEDNDGEDMIEQGNTVIVLYLIKMPITVSLGSSSSVINMGRRRDADG